jgi:hypothetical protein
MARRQPAWRKPKVGIFIRRRSVGMAAHRPDRARPRPNGRHRAAARDPDPRPQCRVVDPDFAEIYVHNYGLVHYGTYLKIKAFLDGSGELTGDFTAELTAALNDAAAFLAHQRPRRSDR